MDRLVDDTVRNCVSCQADSQTVTPDPIKITPLPKRVFREVSVDFLGPEPNGDYFLLIICDYTLYPIVERLTTTSANAVLPRLESVFAMFGIPEILRSDSGPPFHGHLFSEFARKMGFKHRRVTPLHPQANGVAERMMASLSKAIRTAHVSGGNYRTEINEFLMNYRNTSHPSTNVSPAELMFGRKLKTKLPQFSVRQKDHRIRLRDRETKLKNKQYADKKRRAKNISLKIGDKVLIRRDKRQNKLQTAYHPVPARVIKRKGSMITVNQQGKFITRDISFFKLLCENRSSQNRSSPVTVHGRQHPVRDLPEIPSLRRSNRSTRRPAKFKDYT
ncbi:uncharacterized protein K02A2.6-like [Mercenaria mercenaria]|uniref:uncharacterized protein K02A2.6-like n=1 Tax=Mercenaria mercenaria TaxID=6596 RepID=UPI001E1DE4BA|nr:uncharacterized protein K02A2.6-like [Mercenaria mercenaria]